MNIFLFDVKSPRIVAVFVYALLFSFLSGCSTIQFVQHEQPGDQAAVNHWHHSTLNGMVEISKPLNIGSICGKKAWTTITTEFTFYNALPVILVPSLPLVSFYSAWTNRVKCFEAH
jgi:hypothetical protein